MLADEEGLVGRVGWCGEYARQLGFGWANGVQAALMAEYPLGETRQARCLSALRLLTRDGSSTTLLPTHPYGCPKADYHSDETAPSLRFRQ